MDLLRLFLSASASPLVQARTAGPLAVDTGPPGPGGPPLVVDGFQKEVTAKELKPQATILDLLERILPTDAFSVKEGKPGGFKIADLAINLGELKAKVESPDFGDILAALGIAVPPNFDAKNLGQFKKSLAEAVVSELVPPPVKNVFAKIIKALGEFEGATGKIDKPALTTGYRIIPHGELTTGITPDPRPIGPPIRVAPPIQLTINANPVTNSLKGFQGETVGGQKVELPPPPPLSLSLFSTSDRKQEVPIGRLDRDMVESLRVSSMSVSESKPIDLNVLAENMSGRMILQKAPLRTHLGEKLEDMRAPVGKPVLESPSVKVTDQDVRAALSKAVNVVGEADKVALEGRPIVLESAGKRTKLQLMASVKDLVGRQNRTTSDAVAPLKTDHSAGRAVRDDKPISVEALEPKAEHDDDCNALKVEKDETVQLGRPERTLDTSSAKETKHVKAELTTEQFQSAKAKVIEQIEEIAATRGNGKVTIKLSPDDLGTITLAVRSFGDNVEAKITASNDNVRQSLHTHRADLVQSVESRGLSMNSFTVGSESNADAQQHGNGRQHGQDMRQEFARSHNLWGTRHDQTLAPRPTYQRLRYAGVDTFA